MRYAVRSTATTIADALIAVTLAPRCAACDAPVDEPTRGCVCAACWAAIPRTGTVCWTSTWISGARAGGQFDGPLREIIHAFKYDGRRSLARPLAALMRDTAADLLCDADFAVPVPLHAVRHFTRGFNQAAHLAAGLGLPVANALWRVRRTASQSGLTAAERRRNVRDAFAVSPMLSRSARQRLSGAVVVLVDDVRTTGETLDACARVLRDRAGAREVRAITAAVRDPR